MSSSIFDDVLLPINVPILIPSVLTILTCPWLFFKYAHKGWKRAGFSMIFILTLSDFLFSLTVLISIFLPYADYSPYFRFGFYFCSYFSIYWASAIAFLVYKTLTSQNVIDTKQLFIKTLLLVLTVTFTCVLLIFTRVIRSQAILIAVYTPLACVILVSSVFYFKSIKFLRTQLDYEQSFINRYIKSLQLYCLAQFILYGPAIVYLLGMSGFLDFMTDPIHTTVSVYAEGLASLAGFVNAIIFLKQGNVKEYKTSKEQLNLDVTQDLSLLVE